MPVLGLPLLVADPRIPFPAQFAEAVSGATVTGPWRIENVAGTGNIKASVTH